ncbi:hypothetical protein BDP27DRAFT_1343585 [Rhodocollybia butyracea]|uniref:Uncharacterized protein n=1 Tax=Rhodocollybia butyracea TaxID=206335 RepID=A0A9P5P566_9AGAR|nr:hypothetical protein BDP27DRAFT_1343585 [Rhodocollybia butyracea]
MSIPKSRNITNDIMRTTFSQTQPNANASHQTTHSKHRSTNSISSTITNDSNNHNNTHMYSDSSDIRISDGGPSYTDSTAANHTQHHYRHNYPSKTGDQELTLKKTNVNLNGGVYGVTHSFHRDPDMYDVPQTSPPLVSPALSYSSRGSGATLSPSTPYVGSFSASQEAGGDFQGRGIETEVADAR